MGRIGLNTFLQLSWLSGIPSPSLSFVLMLPSYSPGLDGVQVGSGAGVPQEKSGYEFVFAVCKEASVRAFPNPAKGSHHVSRSGHTTFDRPHTVNVSQRG